MNQPKPRATWRIRTSPAYDALCLLNIWSGEPFYTDQHPGVYERWIPRLTDAVRGAYRRLHTKIRVEGQGIISARLCLVFSAIQPSTLEDLLAAACAPQATIAAFLASPYGDRKEADDLLEVLPDLRVILEFLVSSPFTMEQRQDLGHDLEHRQRAMLEVLDRHDVIAAVEAQCGTKLAVDLLEVFTLAYTAPHGIRIIGGRFITALGWSPAVVVRVAAHELLHPPFDHEDPAVRAAIEQLRDVSWIRDAFVAHDPSFGYNTWAGYVEENCVRALDQVIAESFGVARDAGKRWRSEDGGMHVLAAALTPLLRTRHRLNETFQAWFIHQVDHGIGEKQP